MRTSSTYGYGEQSVTGAVVTEELINVNATDSSKVDSISFKTTSPTADMTTGYTASLQVVDEGATYDYTCTINYPTGYNQVSTTNHIVCATVSSHQLSAAGLSKVGLTVRSNLNETGTGTGTLQSPPSAPRFLAGVTDDSHKVVLTWTAPVDNGGAAITDYTVQYSADNGDDIWETFADGVSTNTTATVTGLTNGTAYYFRVRAVNPNGNSSASVTQPRVIPAGDPTVPRAITTAPGQDSILVSWTAPESTGGVPIVGYRASTPVGGNIASCSTTDALTCRITGLTINTDYTVTVTATNAAGRSSSEPNPPARRRPLHRVARPASKGHRATPQCA